MDTLGKGHGTIQSIEKPFKIQTQDLQVSDNIIVKIFLNGFFYYVDVDLEFIGDFSF